MKTENSFQYFRGREAMGRGMRRDDCRRLRGLSRSAWQKGWDDEAALRAGAKRPAEVARENEEGAAWFAAELARWKAETEDYKTEDRRA